MLHEVAIIGAGPAGMAAALQLKRYAVDFIWLEKANSACLLKNANCVENYLGLPTVSGNELLKQYQKHLKKHNIAPSIGEVQNLNYVATKKQFAIKTAKKTYMAKKVIVASGTKPKLHPLIENLPTKLKLLTGYSVYPFLTKRNKVFAIIGAGDAAFDFALSVAKNNFVHILTKSTPRAIPTLINETRKNKNILYHSNTKLVAINTSNRSTLQLCCNTCNIEANYLIAAIGRTPQKDFYSKNLLAHEKKLINKKLLFLAGDVKNGIYRQTALATADGIAAAMTIAKLNE